MRQVLIIGLVVILAAGVLYAANVYTDDHPDELSEYYLQSFTEDTGARNAVAAIYLNYRIYDTLFEALILLVAIAAMLHFFEVGGQK